MAKKAKGNRVQVILECTEHKNSALEDNLYSITFCFLCHDIYSPITLMSFQST